MSQEAHAVQQQGRTKGIQVQSQASPKDSHSAQQQKQIPWHNKDRQGQPQTSHQEARYPQEQALGAWQPKGRQEQSKAPPQDSHSAQQQKQGSWHIKGRQDQPQTSHQEANYPQDQARREWQSKSRQEQSQASSRDSHSAQQQQQRAWQSKGRQEQTRITPQESHSTQLQDQPKGKQELHPQQKQEHSWQNRGRQQPFEQHKGKQQQLVVSPETGIQNISISDFKGGTKGRKIWIETNHISIDFGKLTKAYHYDVQITPDTPKRWLRDVFEQFRRKNFPQNNPAFDGKRNMYSPYELIKNGQILSDEINFQIPHESKTKTYKVSVQFATEVDLSPLKDMKMTTPQQAMQCVEIVLRSAPTLKCIQAGRSFYTRPEQIIKLGEGMEMYYGFYQTVVRGWKPFFNIDVAHKAFPTQMNVIELIAELGSDWRRTVTTDELRNQELTKDIAYKLAKHLKTLRVTYQIAGTKREYRVNGLDTPPRFKKFTIEGKTMTIEEYFQKKKGLRLHYPLMPTIWVGSITRQDKILLPAELCTVVENQTVNRKMTENQTSAMIKQAATPTYVRKNKIMTALRNTRHNENPCVREFGFRINNDFEKIQARVLEPPALEYANGSSVVPNKGVWRQDNYRFFRGAEISTWIIISACGSNLTRECSNLANMVSKFIVYTLCKTTNQSCVLPILIIFKILESGILIKLQKNIVTKRFPRRKLIST